MKKKEDTEGIIVTNIPNKQTKEKNKKTKTKKQAMNNSVRDLLLKVRFETTHHRFVQKLTLTFLGVEAIDGCG